MVAAGTVQAEYAEALARLFSARRFGVILDTQRMRDLLAKCGNPQHALGAVVHVGGTNGKGSTVAMLAAMCRAAGLRTAIYTSPHLCSVRERMVFDGRPIESAEFVAAYQRVLAAGGADYTFFEQLTALAFCWFAQGTPEVTLVEVGLGGRLDATNVVDTSVAVVTGVAFDHQAVLGETLTQIAGEKAGIWKPGVPAVIGISGEPAAEPMLLDAAVGVGASPVVAVRSQLAPPQVAAVIASGLGLRGAHQQGNAASAWAAWQALAVARPELAARMTEAAACAGLRDTKHPGRFELVAGDPVVILDGAHNPQGAQALAATLKARHADLRRVARYCVAVLAVSADKTVSEMLAALGGVVDAVVATRYQHDRAMEPAQLAAYCHDAGLEVSAVTAGLAPALAHARSVGATEIVVAGSLFLVGEARALLLGCPVDPVAVMDPSPVRGK